MPRRSTIKASEAPSGETPEELLARLNDRYRAEKNPNHKDTDPEFELFKSMLDQSLKEPERQAAAIALSKFTRAPLKSIDGAPQAQQKIEISFQPIRTSRSD